MLTPGVTLVAVARQLGGFAGIGHSLEGFEAGVASEGHQRISFFDYRIRGWVKDHFTARAANRDHDHAVIGTDTGILERASDKRRMWSHLDLLDFKLEPFGHRRKFDEIGNSGSQ